MPQITNDDIVSHGNNFKDLTGQIFTRLTVIKFAYKNKSGQVCWLCNCECGEEKIIRGCHLKSGATQSCGCLQKEIISSLKREDLTGKKFGKLIVLNYMYSDDKGQPHWLCRCDCGNEKITLANYLRCGDTKSCGCLQIEKVSGENHWNWKDGSSKLEYSQQWTNKLRESIRNRDNRKCQFPDCIYDDTKETKKLHVHHIDGNKQNCEPYNLISLCNSHHQKIEHNHPELWQDYFYQITGDYK